MRLQTSLVTAFAGLAIAASGFAWFEHSKLTALQTDAVATNDPSALQARIAELMRENRALAAKLAARNGKLEPGGGNGSTADGAADTLHDGPSNAPVLQMQRAETKRDAELDLLSVLSDLPEFQKLLATGQRGAIDTKYAGLFRRLKLSPEQQQQLESLLGDRQSALADALVAAHDQGLTGKDARVTAKTVADATEKSIDESIKSLLGDQGYKQYQNYERTLPQRETVTQLAQRLDNAGAPLSLAQQDRLVQALASGARQDVATARAAAIAAGQKPPKIPTTLNGVPNALSALGVGTSSGAVIMPSAITKAQSFLSGAQLSSLEQLQHEQQAQLTLGQWLKQANAKPKPAPQPSAAPPQKTGPG